MSTPVPNVLLPAKKRRVLPPRVTFWYHVQPWEVYVVSAETTPQQPAGWLPSVAKTRGEALANAVLHMHQMARVAKTFKAAPQYEHSATT